LELEVAGEQAGRPAHAHVEVDTALAAAAAVEPTQLSAHRRTTSPTLALAASSTGRTHAARHVPRRRQLDHLERSHHPQRCNEPNKSLQ